jgi:hypothetical protein
MARLIVSAVSEDTLANPGNRQPNVIVVSVTYNNGQPVTGLSQTNFQIDALIVGPGGSQVDITNVAIGRLPGFYFIEAVPIGAETWKAGIYIFAVVVLKGSSRGQTLTSVLLD